MKSEIKVSDITVSVPLETILENVSLDDIQRSVYKDGCYIFETDELIEELKFARLSNNTLTLQLECPINECRIDKIPISIASLVKAWEVFAINDVRDGDTSVSKSEAFISGARRMARLLQLAADNVEQEFFCQKCKKQWVRNDDGQLKPACEHYGPTT